MNNAFKLRLWDVVHIQPLMKPLKNFHPKPEPEKISCKSSDPTQPSLRGVGTARHGLALRGALGTYGRHKWI